MKEKQQKNMRYSKKTLVTIFAVGLLVVGFTSGFMINLVITEDMTPQEALEHIAKWNLVSATNVTVSNGETGIMNYLTHAHQSSPYILYDDALDLASASIYEQLDDSPTCSSEELAGTTPFDTLFDYVVVIQWDYDHAYNTSSTSWDKTLVQVYINISSTDTEINSVSSEVMLEGDFYDIDGTNDAKMNCYVVGTGGFDLGQDVLYTIDDVKLYYYG